MALYDNIYDVEDFFGEPYPELIEFFKNLPTKGVILDLGCGQGRDALALSKLGYQVIGIDESKLGINQIIQKAKQLHLTVTGITGNLFDYPVSNKIDIVLIDFLIHFAKDDKERELALLNRISQELKPGGIICICIWKSKENEKILKNIFLSSGHHWEIINDSYLNYTFKDKVSNHSVDMQFNMFIVKKKNE
ncbi:MAG: class I SAM-dependent methyltransferase [Chlorobi bacterium]|nr:class I SAM-dependent methyltransferase [Chlorobiota bacterium]